MGLVAKSSGSEFEAALKKYKELEDIRGLIKKESNKNKDLLKKHVNHVSI